jgi:hypothetical protein
MDSEQFNPGARHKKRPGWVSIAVVLLSAVIIGGVFVYHAAHSRTRTFDALANTNQPLVISTTDTIANNQSSSTMQSDGHGHYIQSFELRGKPMTTIYTPGGFFQCQGAAPAEHSCVKYPNDLTQSNVDPGASTFNQDKIKQLQRTAKYNGQQKCPYGNGTCDVWYSTTQYDTTTYYYINTASKRIVQTIHYGRFGADKNSAKVTVKTTYTFKDVRIVVPTIYTDAPKSQ